MIIIESENVDPKCDTHNDGDVIITGRISGVVVGEYKRGANYQEYLKNHCSLYISSDTNELDCFTINSSEGMAYGIHGFIVEARVLTHIGDKVSTIFATEILVPFVGAFGATTRYRTTGFLVNLGINNIINEAQNAPAI